MNGKRSQNGAIIKPLGRSALDGIGIGSDPSLQELLLGSTFETVPVSVVKWHAQNKLFPAIEKCPRLENVEMLYGSGRQ